MAITPVNEPTVSYNEKSGRESHEHVESTGAVSPLTGDLADGKLTKETILAYIVRLQTHEAFVLKKIKIKKE
jgi:hypothetical protein